MSIKSWTHVVGKNVRDLALLLGVGPRLKADNRRILETIVFPQLNRDPELCRILFVGCHWYTWHYRKIFSTKEFWTLEIDPQRARYGSAKHVVDSVEFLERHFTPASLDVVLMIGVIGWGLDDPATIERSLAACREVLREGGWLILGCDEVPEHMPVDLNQSLTLQSLTPTVFPGLATARYRCQGELQHTLLFFTKTKA